LVIILYQSIAIPYSLAFEAVDNDPNNDYVSISTNMLFAVDIALTFNTAIADNEEPDLYITKRKVIAIRYLTGWYADFSLLKLSNIFINYRFV